MPETRILLVEDNPDDVNLARIAFRDAAFPHRIDVAVDGAQALAALESAAPSRLPVAVVLDLNLPKISGLEVLRRVRANPRLSGLPVIILTSSDDPKEVAAARELGVLDYLRKPVEFAKFLEVVRGIRDRVEGLIADSKRRRR